MSNRRQQHEGSVCRVRTLPTHNNQRMNHITLRVTFALVIAAIVSICLQILYVSDAFAKEAVGSTSTIPELGISSAVEVVTEAPTTANGVEILTSGEWRNACVPTYERTVVQGNSVHIFAVAERMGMVCGQVESEWSFSTHLEMAEPGIYRIDVFVESEWDERTRLHNTLYVNVDGDIQVIAGTTRDDAPVSFSVDGVNSDGCVPSYISHAISGNTITVEAEKPGANIVCGQAVTPWEFDIDLGMLDAGEYMVEVYVTSHTNSSTNRALYKSSSLSVDGVVADESETGDTDAGSDEEDATDRNGSDQGDNEGDTADQNDDGVDEDGADTPEDGDSDASSDPSESDDDEAASQNFFLFIPAISGS